ncbi:MarR family winged helix-turn-helix transcriptional regulator [Phaeobacter inhibens]|uniref:MarR family winged helix-turn-helix transcriptional regulator n=1 Tax=Phaeobacter inhibens TaxID=221822 RepID=UPI0021A95C58|nr:MarR family transcriptional regulator [Phaeobacter inhibens]
MKRPLAENPFACEARAPLWRPNVPFKASISSMACDIVFHSSFRQPQKPRSEFAQFRSRTTLFGSDTNLDFQQSSSKSIAHDVFGDLGTRMNKLPEKADEMFCYAVYNASHAINQVYGPMLRPLGLTYPQYITLMLLWERDQQGVSELAAQLSLKTSTLTPLLKRLENMGFVRRMRGTDDERQVFVHLTDDGIALHAASREITSCLIEATGLELSALKQITDGLSRLTDNLKNAPKDRTAT